MANESASDIEALVRQGEWLPPSRIATLFGVDKTTVIRWLDIDDKLDKSEKMGYRRNPMNGYLLCDPADVLALFEKTYKVHRAGDDA